MNPVEIWRRNDCLCVRPRVRGILRSGNSSRKKPKYLRGSGLATSLIIRKLGWNTISTNKKLSNYLTENAKCRCDDIWAKMTQTFWSRECLDIHPHDVATASIWKDLRFAQRHQYCLWYDGSMYQQHAKLRIPIYNLLRESRPVFKKH